MEPTLPCRILVRFEDTETTIGADCLENLSNSCLYLLRTAFGVTVDPCTPLIQKTDSLVARIFAGLLALTLFLPLSFIGAVLCKSSNCHLEKYCNLMQAHIGMQERETILPPDTLRAPPPTTPTKQISFSASPEPGMSTQASPIRTTPVKPSSPSQSCTTPASPDSPENTTTDNPTPFFTPTETAPKPPPSPTSLKPYKPMEGETSPIKD